MIGTLLQSEFKELIDAKDWNTLRESLSELSPPDVAELIIELPPQEESLLFRVLPREKAAAVFEYLPPGYQQELLRSLNSADVKQVIEEMNPDDRTRLFEELPAKTTRELLETLSPDELKNARTLLGYPERTAGRYMTPEYVALPPDITAAEALDRIRHTGRGKETLAILFLVDDKGKLLEELRLGSLVLADPQIKIADIDDRPLVTINVHAPVSDVLAMFDRYDRWAMPVVDDAGIMLGIITSDDVLEFAQKKATADIQQLGGSEALDKPYLTVGFWEMVRKRGGWLAILFLGEMLTATAMGYFEGEIEKAAVVALFVPLIISSGGNSGSQGTSLIIRSLAIKELRLRDWWRVFGREVRTGLALGVFLGVIGFCRISAWQGLSHIPHVGSFFLTHKEEIPAGYASNSIVLDEDKKLDAPLTLPAGSLLHEGTLVPSNTPLPANVQPSKDEPTAYGAHWFLIGLTVFVALIGVITWGSLAGSMLPFILRRLGFDPATSSAPFVATLVDVTGLIIYFMVAKVILTGTLL